MPIVFEEVSTEIAAPPERDTPAASGGGQTCGEPLIAAVQAQLAVQRERQARLHAD